MDKTVADRGGENVDPGSDKHEVPILLNDELRAHYRCYRDRHENQGGTNQEVPEPGNQGDRTYETRVYAGFIAGTDGEVVPGITCEPATSCLVLEKLRVCVRHLQEQREDESGLDERKGVDRESREDRDECFFHRKIMY